MANGGEPATGVGEDGKIETETGGERSCRQCRGVEARSRVRVRRGREGSGEAERGRGRAGRANGGRGRANGGRRPFTYPLGRSVGLGRQRASASNGSFAGLAWRAGRGPCLGRRAAHRADRAGYFGSCLDVSMGQD